ncbi:hypothetical protein CPC08DRAFT_759905 [Agrocybe pediades]|nr:hypothetical protein CPC08DRAFT_759905 [Agrocybe pediades]
MSLNTLHFALASVLFSIFMPPTPTIHLLEYPSINILHYISLRVELESLQQRWMWCIGPLEASSLRTVEGGTKEPTPSSLLVIVEVDEDVSSSTALQRSIIDQREAEEKISPPDWDA